MQRIAEKKPGIFSAWPQGNLKYNTLCFFSGSLITAMRMVTKQYFINNDNNNNNNNNNNYYYCYCIQDLYGNTV